METTLSKKGTRFQRSGASGEVSCPNLHYGARRKSKIYQSPKAVWSLAGTRCTAQVTGKCIESVIKNLPTPAMSNHVQLRITISNLCFAMQEGVVPKVGFVGRGACGCCSVVQANSNVAVSTNQDLGGDSMSRHDHGCSWNH
eukprot:5897098-Amphidinium_carterae.1